MSLNRNKFQKNYLRVKLEKEALELKKKNYNLNQTQQNSFDIIKVLYDSGWITPGRPTVDGFVGNSDIFFSISYSMTENQNNVIRLYYDYSHEFKIDESYLPFIKVLPLVKNVENISHFPTVPYAHDRWDANYYQIYGDSTLIYQGNYPNLDFQSETDRINGNFSASNASKWYYGTITWTDIYGDDWSITDGYIVRVRTLYDEIDLGGGAYRVKHFDCSAIDGISSTSVSGTGLYQIRESHPGNPTVVTYEEKNKTMTAPLYDDDVHTNTIVYLYGHAYKNGEFQKFYTVGTPKSIASLFNNVKTFSFNWSSEDGETRYWRLFYSSSRAVPLEFVTSIQTFGVLPTTDDYQSGNLPYTHLYVHENPGDYPLVVQSSTRFLSGYESDNNWIKLSNNRYLFKISGCYLLKAKHCVPIPTTRPYMDDVYDIGGDTYVLSSSDHTAKNKTYYIPDFKDMKFKVMFLLKNPFVNITTNQYKLQ